MFGSAASRAPLARLLRRWVGLAAVLALMLVSAPLPRALHSECRLCPPSCPMHRQPGDHADEHAGAAAASMPTCHGVAAARQGAPAAAQQGPRLTRPPCGNHAEIGAPGMPPMILPSAVRERIAMRAGIGPAPDRARRDRADDPPDTPPPISPA